MNHTSINMLAPSTKDIKTDQVAVKASENTSKDSDNTFESQLSKIKGKSTKVAKSVVKNNVKDIAVNKSIAIKELDEIENKEAVYNMILSLISNVLEIPIEDINKILEEMNITPIDLLSKDTFKSFLAHAYPAYDESQLLFDGEKLKDISKLFVKLEQISTLIDGDQNTVVVEQLMSEDEVVKTTTTTLETRQNQTQENESAIVAPPIVNQAAQNTVLSKEQTIKNTNIEDSLEGSLSEEGIFNFKQMGLGINVPIQAFNSTIGAKLWDAQTATKTDVSTLLQDNSLTSQIINKIDISSLGSQKEITMELSPKELGNLSVKLVETNGILVAHIRVENDKTKELLLSEMAQLQQTLEKQGLSISEVNVEVRQNAHQSQMEKEKQKSSRRIQELIDRNLLEEQESSMQVDEITGELVETEVNYRV